MSLLPFAEWCEHTFVGTVIRQSTWMFPIIEAVHLLALAAIGGAVLIVDFRLLGWGMWRQPVEQVARDAHPYFVGSLLTMLVSGILLFLSEATKCYSNPAFWIKMTFLLLAIVHTFTIRNRVTFGEGTRHATARLVAAVSMLLWLGVGLGGRGIGFY